MPVASKDDETRKRLFDELVATEASYVDGLSILANVYKEPMAKKQKRLKVEPSDISSIFSNLEAIRQLHSLLLKMFKSKPEAIIETLHSPCRLLQDVHSVSIGL